MGEKGKNLLVRTLTAIALIAVVVFGLLISRYGFLALLAVTCAGCIWEFLGLAAHRGARPQKFLSLAAGVAAVGVTFLVSDGTIGAAWFAALAPLVSALFAAELFRKKEDPILNISVSTGALVYVAVPLCLLCVLAMPGGVYDPRIVLVIIGVVTVNDTFAYLTGIMFGRHRLFERISPKKSWEGFFGGLVFAIGAAALYGYLTGANVALWAGLGAVIVAGAVLGDLVESLMKRSAGVKDSGNLLPGHGGILDRMDSLLFTVPLVFTYFSIFGI